MNNHPEQPPNQGEDRQGLLLLLQDMQRRFGYLSDQLLRELAKSVGATVSEIYGIATFYSFLSVRPQGRNLIRACKSLPCDLKDSRLVISSIEDILDITAGKTTPDGRFSFELVNCIGACDSAPAMLVNNDLHSELTPQKISKILKRYE